MSLSSLIEKLTTLVSKNFVFAWFLPTLIFAFLNGLLIYAHVAPVKSWANGQLQNPRAFDLSALVVGLATVAYLLSSVGVFLREVLEGRHLGFLGAAAEKNLRARQQKRLVAIRGAYKAARDENLRIGGQKMAWREKLQQASVRGISGHSGVMTYSPSDPAAGLIARLRELQDSAQPPRKDQIDAAVDALCLALEANDARVGDTLSGERLSLLTLIDYAINAWGAIEVANFSRLDAQFGASHYVAPTAMGNVAESMQNYALSRYELDLETYWPRLQAVMQGATGSQSFFATLQDAKTQLDFLVACCWLSLFTAVPWTVVLLMLQAHWWEFVLCAVGGPLAAYFLYLLAVKNYATLAVLIGSGVDLYRFQLLQAMRLPLPRGIQQERALWHTLRRLSSFGNNVDVSYNPDAKGPGS